MALMVLVLLIRPTGLFGASPVSRPDRAPRDARADGAPPTPGCALAALALFALVPLVIPLFPGRPTSHSRSRIFGALVASYDVVIGYTGIVSFGHAMYLRLRRLRGGARGRAFRRADLRPSPRWAFSPAWSCSAAGGRAHRRVLAARQGDLLRHDHPGLRGVRAASSPCSGASSRAARTGSRLGCPASSPSARTAGGCSASPLTGKRRHLLRGARACALPLPPHEPLRRLPARPDAPGHPRQRAPRGGPRRTDLRPPDHVVHRSRAWSRRWLAAATSCGCATSIRSRRSACPSCWTCS